MANPVPWRLLLELVAGRVDGVAIGRAFDYRARLQRGFEDFLLAAASAGIWISPLRSNIYATLPELPRLPLFLLKMLRMSAAVRFLLSVATSISMAILPWISLEEGLLHRLPSQSPRPLLDRPLDRVVGHALGLGGEDGIWRRRGFKSGSPPPSRAAIVTSRERLLSNLLRLASCALDVLQSLG